MPTVSSSYWVLTVITAQLAMLVYIGLFAAAIRLRYKKPEVVRAYRIRGKNWGMWLVAGVGLLMCVLATLLGFFPPDQIKTGKLASYEALLIGGMIIFTLPAYFLYRYSQKRR